MFFFGSCVLLEEFTVHVIFDRYWYLWDVFTSILDCAYIYIYDIYVLHISSLKLKVPLECSPPTDRDTQNDPENLRPQGMQIVLPRYWRWFPARLRKPETDVELGSW